MVCSAGASPSMLSAHLVLQVTHLNLFCSTAIDLGALKLATPIVVPDELSQVRIVLSNRCRARLDKCEHTLSSLTGASRRTDKETVCQHARYLRIQRLGLFLPRIGVYKFAASARAKDTEALGPQCVDASDEACEKEVAQHGMVGAVAEEYGED